MAWEIASDTAPKHVEPWIASTKQENKQIIFELEKIQHKVCYDFLFVCLFVFYKWEKEIKCNKII